MISPDRTDASGLENARAENSLTVTKQAVNVSRFTIPPLVMLIGALVLFVFTLGFAYWSHVLSG